MQASCPVTLPNKSQPPGEQFSAGYHGNGSLWTALGFHGVFIAPIESVRPDGSVGVKFVWFWDPEIEGRLTIEGRRLDAEAPPLVAEIPEGYPGNLQASGVIFPTDGCWEVTGRVGEHSLTFVTLVLYYDEYPLTREEALRRLAATPAA